MPIYMGHEYSLKNKSQIHWMTPDQSLIVPRPKAERMARAVTLTKGIYDPKKEYETNFTWKPYEEGQPMGVHSTWEMINELKNNPNCTVDARVVGVREGEYAAPKRMGKEEFLKNFLESPWNNMDEVKFQEYDPGNNSAIASPISPNFSQGNDFTPLLGGPFYKNLYYYEDYIRMHAEAFYAKNADPAANATIQMTRDFVIGSGFEVQCDQKSPEGKLQMAIWRAFEEVNELQQQIDQACEELALYGEVMWWKLPGNQSKIIFNLGMGDTIPLSIIPRVRLLDPSNLVEIVTYPEDITRVLFYVWLTPTQWQMFQGGLGEGRPTDQKNIQPSIKFIYRTIMADQILHFKINTVTGEKRGRTDLFPIFSYLKRVRDIVDFALIGMQKNAAWAIDTEVDGDQTDIDNYVAAQAALGTIAPAGSEFVHSKKIKREMIANQGASNINSDAFALGMSMVAMGSGFPISYYGTHLSGGQTKASALVATEPVAKKMEKRREVMKRQVKAMWRYAQTSAGRQPLDVDIIFPEIITQDRSQKLKDLALAENMRWLAPETVASIAAKELQVQNYSYRDELEKMKVELPQIPMPLAAPPDQDPTNGAMTDGGGGAAPQDDADPNKVGVMGLTSEDKKQTRINDTKF